MAEVNFSGCGRCYKGGPGHLPLVAALKAPSSAAGAHAQTPLDLWQGEMPEFRLALAFNTDGLVIKSLQMATGPGLGSGSGALGFTQTSRKSGWSGTLLTHRMLSPQFTTPGP